MNTKHVLRLFLFYNVIALSCSMYGKKSFLVRAVRNGDQEEVARLLQSGAAVDQVSRRGRTPLVEAASRGRRDIVTQLLAAHADVNKAGTDGIAPLLMAVKKGNEEVVGQLLNAGAHVDQVDDYGITPLLVAVAKGHEGIVTQLLEAGANVNKANDDGDTPLWEALEEGHEEIVRKLLLAGARVGAWSTYMGDEPKEMLEHNGKLIAQQAEAIRNGCDEAATEYFPGYFPRDLHTIIEKFIGTPITQESVDKSLEYIQSPK